MCVCVCVCVCVYIRLDSVFTIVYLEININRLINSVDVQG